MTETIPPPEVFLTDNSHVACDGTGLHSGHPRVYLQVGTVGFVDCGYCDRRFVLRGGPADRQDLSDPTANPGQDPSAPAAGPGQA